MRSEILVAWSRRPLSLAALSLALGLQLGRSLPGSWWPPLLLAAALAAVAGVFLCLAQAREKALALCLAAAGLAFGLWRVQGLALDLAAPEVPPRAGLRLEGRLISDEGPRPLGRYAWTLADGELSALDGSGRSQVGGLRISLDAKDALGWLPGDRVRLYGTLRQPPRPTNPGEFDYRAYLLGRGLQGNFSARKGWPVQRLAEGKAWEPRRLAHRARAWMTGGLRAGLSPRAAALAQGIVLGDRTAMSLADRSEFAKAGFSDILAVSGTHFTLALGLFLLLARLLHFGRRSQAALGLLLGLAYALITGFEAPVQRAFALFAVWLLARLLDYECEVLLSLAIGALVILGFQPGAFWEPGFQLSFLCTWAVVGLSEPLSQALPDRWPLKARLVLGGVFAAQVALTPVLAFHFHQLNWPGLLSCWVSGLFTLAILGLGLPLGLLGAFFPWLGWPLEQVLRLLDLGAGLLSSLPYAAWSTGTLPGWLYVAWALWPWVFLSRIHKFFLGTSFGALLFFTFLPGSPWAHRHPGLTKVWMFNVGQGDSTLLEFGDGRTLLVDAGAPRPDAGAWVVVPSLRALGIQKLDWVLATHADADHVGGLPWVLSQMPVGQLYYNGKESPHQAWKAVLDLGLPMRALGTQIPKQADEGPWKVLHPSPPLRRTKRKPKRIVANDHSVVLKVEDWLLLTGDLPKKEEKKLLKRGLGRIDVLKVGHHGSRGSTGPDWVRRLKPKEALISSGKGNSYGHPHAKVLELLKGARLWRTDLQGCIYFERHADGSLHFQPWKPAGPEALAQGAERPRSPWRGLKMAQEEAWKAGVAQESEQDED